MDRGTAPPECRSRPAPANGRCGTAARRDGVQRRRGGGALADAAPRTAKAHLGQGRCMMSPIADGRLMRWEVAAEYRELLLGPEGLRLAEWLEKGQARVVKHGPHRTVYRVILPQVDCYIKHCRVHDARAWLRECVRP